MGFVEGLIRPIKIMPRKGRLRKKPRLRTLTAWSRRRGSNPRSRAYEKTEIDWAAFREYCDRLYSPDWAKAQFRRAKEYHRVLLDGDAKDLLALSPKIRPFVMRAISALAKFLGLTEQWRILRQQYGLKWKTLEYFPSMLLPSNSLQSIIGRFRLMYENAGEDFGPYLKFLLLTGLRANEAIKSIKLIQSDYDNYVNKDLLIAEHFRYPKLFLRSTKKAYVSVLTHELIELAKSWKPSSYHALRLRLKRKGIECHLRYARKIYASILRREGIEPELIDLLQGRIPSSVFHRHYLSIDFSKEVERVRQLILKIGEAVWPEDHPTS